MRIMLYEIKKMFRPLTVVIALILTLIVCFFSKQLFQTWFTSSIYGADKNVHFTDIYYGNSTTAEEYRVYKWYIENYGYRMDERTAEKLRVLEYPLLENIIKSRPEFAENGIYCLNDLMVYQEKYFDSKPGFSIFRNYSLSPELTDREIPDTVFLINIMDTLSTILRQSRAYYEKYFDKSDFLKNNGINNYYDYGLIRAEYEREKYLKSNDEERAEFIERCGAEIERLYPEYIAPEIEATGGDLVIDTAREEYLHFEFIYKILEYYDKVKNDTLYLQIADTWQRGMPHSYDAVYQAFWDSERNGASGTASHFAEYSSRVVSRVNEMGEKYYNVRTPELLHGLEYATVFFSVLSAALCVFIIMPYALRDKISRVIPLQYSSKTGRKTLKIQLASALIISFIFSLLCNVGMFVLTLNDLYVEFYVIPMSSYCDGELFWFDMNMWQYLGIFMLFNHLVSGAAAVISFLLGRICGGYVSVFAAQLGVVIAVFFLYKNPFTWLFALPESIFEDFAYLFAIIVTASACGYGIIVMSKRSLKN